MASEWRKLCWGDIVTLEYGRALRGYDTSTGPFRVFGTNGPIGWHHEALCPHDGVIIGRKGAYRGIHYSASPFYVIDTAFYLKKKTDIDLRWAYYELLTHNINAMDSGSAIPSTSRDDFYNLPVLVPPLFEQCVIAHILGTLDDKIELNRHMNETLEAMARALFKSWFVDFDPVRAKAEGRWKRGQSLPGLPAYLYDLFPDRLVDFELGEIPEEWALRPFADTVDIIGGGTPKTSVPEYWGGNIPWFSVVDAPTGSDIWVVNTEKHITHAGLDNSSTRILDIGTAIISARGTVGKIALVGVPMAMNQSCYGLKSWARTKGYFNYFATSELITILRQRTHGSVFDTITRDTLTGIEVVVPPLGAINAFEVLVGPALEGIRMGLLQSRTLISLRDMMLPKIISGEMRVKNVDKFLKVRGI